MPCAKSRGLLLAAALAAVAGPASGATTASTNSAPAEDAGALLRASIDARKSVSYVGQFETVRFSSSRAVATIVKIEHRSPDATRRWYVAPESLYGDYIIQRGASTYEFDTKHERVTVSHNPLFDDGLLSADRLDRVLANYRAIVDPPETVADRQTVSVELVNKYTGERAMRLWLDRSTHLVLKKEEYHGNGSIASRTSFDELQYTTSIPDAVFATALPAGFTQVNGEDVEAPSSDVAGVVKQAGFAPYTPKDLPQGFTLSNGDVKTVGNVKTLHLLYGDGLRNVSLFENATGAAADFGTVHPKTVRFEDHDAQYVEEGPTTLLTWNEHGLHFALVGDLLLPELVAIAKSVVP